ncbi:hypothetical protein HYH03_008608 [Edaphochlamys debaryana]|uniref:Uncharacterized protein n=1 Tax=Edaphochlamys debaryana TaxID=47281 RepID=A0A835XZL4_9CHLO|nr:hypothetical protein HYH03_008608 [Edaphochlamys debaryana]|eukprot:KAG2493188.1 hypothetical protein HYH03_008608 [Edaphochlamys debaryana]
MVSVDLQATKYTIACGGHFSARACRNDRTNRCQVRNSSSFTCSSTANLYLSARDQYCPGSNQCDADSDCAWSEALYYGGAQFIAAKRHETEVNFMVLLDGAVLSDGESDAWEVTRGTCDYAQRTWRRNQYSAACEAANTLVVGAERNLNVSDYKSLESCDAAGCWAKVEVAIGTDSIPATAGTLALYEAAINTKTPVVINGGMVQRSAAAGPMATSTIWAQGSTAALLHDGTAAGSGLAAASKAALCCFLAETCALARGAVTVALTSAAANAVAAGGAAPDAAGEDAIAAIADAAPADKPDGGSVTVLGFYFRRNDTCYAAAIPNNRTLPAPNLLANAGDIGAALAEGNPDMLALQVSELPGAFNATFTTYMHAGMIYVLSFEAIQPAQG